MADYSANIAALQSMSGRDINRIALFLTTELCNGAKDVFRHTYDFHAHSAERMSLALAVWQTLWELKEFGQMQTHPEYLIQHAASNMRDYQYRDYSHVLIWLCRAFARQFGDCDNMPQTKFVEYPRSINAQKWWLYAYDAEGYAQQSDRAAHSLFIKRIPELERFGNFFLCESYPSDYTEVDGLGILVHERKDLNVVPFDSYDEAQLFLAQLVDLLNSGEKDPVCPAATQFVRDVLEQAPVEQMRMEEERQAAERAKREEAERRRKEAEQQAAIARAKREEAMRDGVHVYIFQLDNDTVKIGISNNIMRRVKEVEGAVKVTKIAYSRAGFKEWQAREIERDCHNHFRDKRKMNEYFFAPFDEAKEYLQTLTPILTHY